MISRSPLKKEINAQIIYADYAATAPLHPHVAAALQHEMECMQEDASNPSSTHALGRSARARIEGVRESLAPYFGKKSSHILFTSGATESNNMVLKNYEGPVFIGATEHDSLRAVRPDAVTLSVHEDGTLNLNMLEDCLKKADPTPLVVVMAANNETGVIHPLHEIFDLCEHYGARTHVDSVQAVGKIAVSDYNRASTFTLSAHKIGGLSGVGALVFNPAYPPLPLLKGGGQERNLRPGTENFLGILSLMYAMQSLSSHDWVSVGIIRDAFEEQILSLLPKQHHSYGVIGKHAPRLPNISNITMPFVKSAVQHMFFDQHAIAVSFGAACSSGKVTESHVLKAMNIHADYRACSLRFSFGPMITSDAIEKIVDVWKKLYVQQNEKAEPNILTLRFPQKTMKKKG